MFINQPNSFTEGWGGEVFEINPSYAVEMDVESFLSRFEVHTDCSRGNALKMNQEK